jgi:hypothetical protein
VTASKSYDVSKRTKEITMKEPKTSPRKRQISLQLLSVASANFGRALNRLVPPKSEPVEPIRRRRIEVAIVLGLFAGAIFWAGHDEGGHPRSDWDQIWVTARGELHGQDPYAVGDSIAAAGYDYPLFYPATASTLALPFAMLSIRLAQAAWMALGIGALVYCMTAKGWWGLLALLSAPALDAIRLGQWSPLLVGATAIPWLGLAWMAKPTIGLALFIGWPSRPAAVGGALLVFLSLVMVPTWPGEWLARTHGASHFIPPILRPGGFLLLLAFLRWQRPEARMLGALAILPHTAALYEMIPLFLIPRSAREMIVMVSLSVVAGVLVITIFGGDPHRELARTLSRQWPALLGLIYFPALWLVVRRGAPGSPT